MMGKDYVNTEKVIALFEARLDILIAAAILLAKQCNMLRAVKLSNHEFAPITVAFRNTTPEGFTVPVSVSPGRTMVTRRLLS